MASRWRALGFLGLVFAVAGCRVPQPTIRQGLDFGFRTPKQAFQSWRTAVQGDLLAEEYRCFSRGWRARNGGTSLLQYSEARDAILEKYPQLRWAVYQAEAPEILTQRERLCVLQARIPGPLWAKDRYLAVEMRRQGFWDLTVGENPQQPEFGDQVPAPFESGLFYFDKASDRFFVIVNDFSRTTGLPNARSIELAEAGWEWKIDNFEILEEPLIASSSGL